MQQVIHKTRSSEAGVSLWHIGDTDSHYLVLIRRSDYLASYVHAVPKTDYQLEGDDLI